MKVESTKQLNEQDALLSQNCPLSDARFQEKFARSQYQSGVRHRYWSCETEITSYSKHDYGWDGHETKPIDVLTRLNALEFLKEIRDRILLINEDYIYPTGDGTIVIDFQNDLDDLVSVEFGEASIGFFTQTEGHVSQVDEGLINTIKAIDFVWERSETKDLPKRNG